MTPFFTRERFGRPQLYAALLLLAFAAQCLWLMCRVPLRLHEMDYIRQGLTQWREGLVDGSSQPPLIALISSAGIAVLPRVDQKLTAPLPRLLARLPFLAIALLFAASVWYVTHRLYGNAGGYVALALYCFSPMVLRTGSFVNAEGPAAWGFFGGIFSGIALSHTVYALGESPGQQIAGYRLWRWRRIVLLGVAFGIAVGANWASAIVVPLALVFMLYLAPGRRTACLSIVAVACAIAGAVLLAAYFFDVAALRQAIAGTDPYYPVEFPGAGIRYTPFWVVAGTVVILLFAVAVITYLLWRRARYFGNTAPLLVFAVLCLGAMLSDSTGFRVHLLIFMIVFIAGLAADLLESKHRRVVLALLVLLLGVQAGWALEGLLRTGGPK
jgi:hypothetical protein